MSTEPKGEFLEAIEALEEITGLHICVNFSAGFIPVGHPSPVDWRHRAHRTRFCEIVKSNRKMRSCGGYDGTKMTALAARLRRPFVNICHAGVAEVIVPIMYLGRHVATIFCGQVVTEKVERRGFDGVRRRVEGLGVDINALRRAYDNLPRMPERKLLQIGRVISLVGSRLAEGIGHKSMEMEAILHGHPRMEKAIAFVREHCCEDVTVEEAARVCGVSTAYFCRLFRRFTGVSFKRYVTELRMARAQQLLVDTSLNIIEIALQVGYSRHSYFSRRFREFVGVTPRDFRKRVRLEKFVSKDEMSKK